MADTPDWKRLELIVADIQRQLAPNAEVRHDHWVVGRSGRRRKLDVTVTQKIGTYAVFIAFDCKRHKRPVALKDVAAFAEQIQDVDGNLGVMISNSGYDAGAKAVAAKYNMILQTHREAATSDWQQIIGKNSWCTIAGVQLVQISASVRLADNEEAVPVEFGTAIFDEQHEEISSIKQIFWDAWRELSRPVGDFTIDAEFGGEPSYLLYDKTFLEVQECHVSAKLVAKVFPVNLHFSKGDVLQDVDANDPAYRQLISKGFEWQRVMSEQPGQEISPEEYQRIMTESKFAVDLKSAKTWLRVVVTQAETNDAS